MANPAKTPTARGTTTSSFGVSKRESHDSSGFYSRFSAPLITTDVETAGPEVSREVNELFVGDSRDMNHIESASVALVVTSPPYFAGKEYEEALGQGHVPGSYIDYLEMLHDVFAECVRCLEPGGRIAVNVANLGRRPYRSLSADVVAVLQDRLGLLMRGEIIWQKQRGAAGNCAWGSFQRPGNPVMRDVTERVLVASKGRFDRTPSAAKRDRIGLPSTATITRDEFMDATLDVWEFPAESATRVGHPAPFPVALPERLIQMHTYEGDLVLDPFVGSGTTAVAAVSTGRNFAGYDTDPDYVEAAARRVAEFQGSTGASPQVNVGSPVLDDPLEDALARGISARDVAQLSLEAAGAEAIKADPRLGGGLDVSFSAEINGSTRLIEVCGSFSSSRGGLNRAEVLWKSLGKVGVAAEVTSSPLILLTPELPSAGPGAKALDTLVSAGSVRVVVLGIETTVADLATALK